MLIINQGNEKCLLDTTWVQVAEAYLVLCSQPVAFNLLGDEWLFQKGCISDILPIRNSLTLQFTKLAKSHWQNSMGNCCILGCRHNMKTCIKASDSMTGELRTTALGPYRREFWEENPTNNYVAVFKTKKGNSLDMVWGRGQVGTIPTNVRHLGGCV